MSEPEGFLSVRAAVWTQSPVFPYSFPFSHVLQDFDRSTWSWGQLVLPPQGWSWITLGSLALGQFQPEQIRAVLRLLQVLCCPTDPSNSHPTGGEAGAAALPWHTARVLTHLASRTLSLFFKSRVFKVIIRRFYVFPSKFFFTIYNDDWKECNLITLLKLHNFLFLEKKINFSHS